MGTMWNGKDGEFEDVSFLNGASTESQNSGGSSSLDPNFNQDSGSTTQKTGEDSKIGPVEDGGVIDAGASEDKSVPDYSGEADAIQGDGNMDYTVPGTPDLTPPVSSGTAEPTQTNWDVTKEQTVQGQLEDLYNRDSPFFEQARQRAIRQHLSAGGQNSAMAAGFGELAAMDQAFKVAFQDAQTYARSAEFNASMANQFSLAEQRFIQNAILSDQAYDQAAALQTQRVEAQMESIVLDYKGRNQLMDKELDQWFLKAKQEFAYNMETLSKQADLQMRVNNMQALTNFWVAGFQSVMEVANNPNLTPEQSRAAMEQGMIWWEKQREAFTTWLNGASIAMGGKDFLATGWAGGSSGYPNWADFSSTA